MKHNARGQGDARHRFDVAHDCNAGRDVAEFVIAQDWRLNGAMRKYPNPTPAKNKRLDANPAPRAALRSVVFNAGLTNAQAW